MDPAQHSHTMGSKKYLNIRLSKINILPAV
jgi:hypothetical protein